MNDKPRKSVRQLALDAAQVDGVDPWACPRCGCKDWQVAGTYVRSGKQRRQRVCRHCNEVSRTYEVPVPHGFEVVLVPLQESDDQTTSAG